MKIKFCSLLLIALMSLTVFTVFAGEAKPHGTPDFDVVSAGYLPLPSGSMEWCRVSLRDRGSSLNVRDTNGRVVSKLKNGASVFVDTYDGGFARVNVRRRGRLITLGWVASEYLVC